MQVTSASADFATTNGDRSTELVESFLLVYRYLDFDNDYYLQFLIFVQLKFVWENLKMQVTSASVDFATTNGDRSTERIESFLLVYRYLDFDNDYYLQFLIFVQLKFVWENLKMQVTSASADFATTNGDRSTELIESFLLVYRYLDFDNG